MSSVRIASADIAAAMRRFSLVGMLGWQDLKQRYRRSVLGQFWLTLSMGIMIATIGIVFGQIYHVSMTEFFPFLAVGMIAWSFISTLLMEGCTSFILAESIIKQLPIPLFVHVLRVVWRNVLILAHNILILPLVFVVVGKPLGWVACLSLPGFLLVVVNLMWVVLILSVVCTRYRDLTQIVTSFLQVVFYLTPIMWMPSAMLGRKGLYLLNLNPGYHLIEIIRAPLLGYYPSAMNWAVSIGLALMGWAAAILLYGRYKRRVPYWL